MWKFNPSKPPSVEYVNADEGYPASDPYWVPISGLVDLESNAEWVWHLQKKPWFVLKHFLAAVADADRYYRTRSAQLSDVSSFNYVSDWLRQKIRKSGLSITEIANAAGTRRETIHRWLSGKRRPDPQSLQKLCDVLGVSLDDALKEYVPKRNGRPKKKWVIRDGVLMRRELA